MIHMASRYNISLTTYIHTRFLYLMHIHNSMMYFRQIIEKQVYRYIQNGIQFYNNFTSSRTVLSRCIKTVLELVLRVHRMLPGDYLHVRAIEGDTSFRLFVLFLVLGDHSRLSRAGLTIGTTHLTGFSVGMSSRQVQMLKPQCYVWCVCMYVYMCVRACECVSVHTILHAQTNMF
jgi:hypothetical protein